MTCPCCAGLGPAMLAPFQGPPGPAGPRGPMASYGYGDVTYTERTVGPEDSFPANERNRLLFAPDPALTQRQLTPPFDGHEFWVDDRIMGRALYDRLAVQVNLIITSQQADGKLRLTADVGSALGQPVGATSSLLFNAPNDPERVTLFLRIRTLAGMLSNGAALWLTPTVPILVLSETVWVAPESIYPSPP